MALNSWEQVMPCAGDLVSISLCDVLPLWGKYSRVIFMGSVTILMLPLFLDGFG